MRLPDFIIGGAPRSGTTWLYQLLARHPGIYLASPPRPEPKFFLVEELYARGLDWYSQQWFENAPRAALCGEKSANYLESTEASRRVARDLPKIKMVFILRDPVRRAWSNYLWSRMNGLEHDSFEDALGREDERQRSIPPERRYSRPHAYFSRGLYAELLQPWLQLLPQEQVLCLRGEDLAERPHGVAEQLHAYLGVAVRRHDADGLGVVNAAERRDGERLDPRTEARLRERYAEPNRRLAQLLGRGFRPW